jgi:hypothetical protein
VRTSLIVLALAAAPACLVGCKGSGLPFLKVSNYASVAPDARLDGVGRVTPAPDDEFVAQQTHTFRALNNPADLRFPPTRPVDVLLLAGRDRLDAYVVLGVVSAGDNGGIGSDPRTYGDNLRRLAALLGADVVLDVHVEGGLAGLAARRRDRGSL